MAFVQIPLRSGGGIYVKPDKITGVLSSQDQQGLWSVILFLDEGSQLVVGSEMEEAEASGFARHLVQLLDGSKFN